MYCVIDFVKNVEGYLRIWCCRSARLFWHTAWLHWLNFLVVHTKVSWMSREVKKEWWKDIMAAHERSTSNTDSDLFTFDIPIGWVK